MMAGVLLAAQVGVIALLVAGVSASVLTVVFQIGVLVALTGFTLVAPNQSKVVTLFGRYLGTVRQNGLRWTCPFTKREQVSLRVRNFDSDTLKVNDAMGNPIEVAAVVVWRVVDTAKAVFDVEDYENFVEIQTETAVRHMASAYPYDTYERGQVSLQSNAEQVMATLHAELQVHLAQAGVEVLRTQLRRLAYAPEIAGEMLRRQQAEAVVAARQRIVEGAVGMVDHALELLSAREIVALDEERKAAMVSNLLVVLCSESRTQPVVNTGTLYQ
jgi:regulator of protease activity HflC (stomatin/prohibitin superfamily)